VCVAALNDQTPSLGFTLDPKGWVISAGAQGGYSVEVNGTVASGRTRQDCQISGTVASPAIELGLGAGDG
jgi:hypothetical protein